MSFDSLIQTLKTYVSILESDLKIDFDVCITYQVPKPLQVIQDTKNPSLAETAYILLHSYKYKTFLFRLVHYYPNTPVLADIISGVSK